MENLEKIYELCQSISQELVEMRQEMDETKEVFRKRFTNLDMKLDEIIDNVSKLN